MDSEFTFKQMEKNLDDGYQIYFTYVRNRYLIFKTLLTEDPKNPQPRHAVITHRRVKEMFPFMTDVEYKISNNEVNF